MTVVSVGRWTVSCTRVHGDDADGWSGGVDRPVDLGSWSRGWRRPTPNSDGEPRATVLAPPSASSRRAAWSCATVCRSASAAYCAARVATTSGGVLLRRRCLSISGSASTEPRPPAKTPQTRRKPTDSESAAVGDKRSTFVATTTSAFPLPVVNCGRRSETIRRTIIIFPVSHVTEVGGSRRRRLDATDERSEPSSLVSKSPPSTLFDFIKPILRRQQTAVSASSTCLIRAISFQGTNTMSKTSIVF